MKKFGVDLDNPELMDLQTFNQNGFPEAPRIQEQSDSHSFRNNPFKDNIMFNSPMNKVLAIGQPTPGHLSCLGFTPWTPLAPKDIGNNNPDHSTAKTQFRKYEQLSFEEDQVVYYPSTPAKKRISSPQERLEYIPETPAKKDSKKQLSPSLKRTERKRKQIEMIDYVKTQESKCHRGLRNLASSVKQIITRLGVATAKQIAEALIKQLQQEKEIAPNSKEQQNIKRRVYDALKVLVSAQVLIRDNNKRLIAKPVISKNTNTASVHNILKQKIASLRRNIEQKTQKAILMNHKWTAGHDLIERNKKNPIPTNEKIFFPFIGMYLSEDNVMGVKVQRNVNCTSIELNKGSVRMIGDIDLVLQLKLIEERSKASGDKEIEEEDEENQPTF